ncbi:hypothetical protein ACFO4O_06490 [Glaciecola siphonariae]|uniref:Ankyrin repeat domain-containing protein n=1 Tax=Glaciecola siphonariae TaxID=521012 RepID=A0ABV9LUF3_9ALTE
MSSLTKLIFTIVAISVAAFAYYYFSVHSSSNNESQGGLQAAKNGEPDNVAPLPIGDSKVNNPNIIVPSQKSTNTRDSQVVEEDNSVYSLMSPAQFSELSSDERMKYLQRAKSELAKTLGSEDSTASRSAKNIQDLFSSSVSNDWEAFMHSVNYMHENGHLNNSLALSLAIQHSAPNETITSLLEMGAQFTGEHIAILASKSQWKKIEEYQNYGLDITMTDSEGRNALHYAMLNANDVSTFDFLLNQNIPVNLGQSDLLSEAISKAIINPRAIYFVERLINSGANIKSEHTNAVNGLAVSDAELYDKFMMYAPELINKDG